MDSPYNDKDYIAQAVSSGQHREVIGGLWELMGSLQLSFMKHVGLIPTNYLLDLGCGSLRGGVKFIEYLDSAHYYGIDINQSLLDSGYDIEICTNHLLKSRFPKTHLQCVADFDATAFGINFDFVIANSVFTHLMFNNIRLCFEKLYPSVKRGGKFCTTYFHLPEGRLSYIPQQHSPGDITTYGYRDPYHYRLDDFRHAISGLPWVLADETDWGHPRAQRMLIFERT